jgi:hypothetical protein
MNASKQSKVDRDRKSEGIIPSLIFRMISCFLWSKIFSVGRCDPGGSKTTQKYSNEEKEDLGMTQKSQC